MGPVAQTGGIRWLGQRAEPRYRRWPSASESTRRNSAEELHHDHGEFVARPLRAGTMSYGGNTGHRGRFADGPASGVRSRCRPHGMSASQHLLNRRLYRGAKLMSHGRAANRVTVRSSVGPLPPGPTCASANVTASRELEDERQPPGLSRGIAPGTLALARHGDGQRSHMRAPDRLGQLVGTPSPRHGPEHRCCADAARVMSSDVRNVSTRGRSLCELAVCQGTSALRDRTPAPRSPRKRLSRKTAASGSVRSQGASLSRRHRDNRRQGAGEGQDETICFGGKSLERHSTVSERRTDHGPAGQYRRISCRSSPAGTRHWSGESRQCSSC